MARPSVEGYRWKKYLFGDKNTNYYGKMQKPRYLICACKIFPNIMCYSTCRPIVIASRSLCGIILIISDGSIWKCKPTSIYKSGIYNFKSEHVNIRVLWKTAWARTPPVVGTIVHDPRIRWCEALAPFEIARDLWQICCMGGWPVARWRPWRGWLPQALQLAITPVADPGSDRISIWPHFIEMRSYFFYMLHFVISCSWNFEREGYNIHCICPKNS